MSLRGHGALGDSLARSHGVLVEGGRVRITDRFEQAETVTSGLGLPSDPTTTEELPADIQLGRFTLLRLLGRGGMGVVYTAYDELLDRVVAIKMVRGDRHDTRLLARVLREAKALAKLSHPNVVQIYDVGEYEGQVFIAMEFVQGPTLRAWSEARRGEGAGAREILDMFIQAGRGLAEAHAAGLVHRDFKPDNVLVGPDGRARVLDFGLVTARGAAASHAGHAALSAADAGPAEPPLTRAGAVLGTPAYMSPEQWLGRQADARSDQFSFCAALYEALHGAHPFPIDSQQARQAAIARGELRTGPAALPVPGHVASALRRGMSFRPDERFPDLAALLAVLADDPAARRRRRLRGAGLLVVTGLFVAVVVLALQGVRQRWRAEQREADADAALAAVDARITEARVAGDRAAAERLLVTFLEDPVHKDTRAIARAWLGEAARRRDDGDTAAAISAHARAFTSARHTDESAAALRGLAALFRARLEWDSLGQVLALLDRRHPEAAAAPELAALRADVALARRDFAGARELLAGGPAGALAGALARARSTPFRDTRAVYGRVGDELWLLEHRDGGPILHAARADATLAPLWSHPLPPSARVELVDPRGPLLLAWQDGLVVYGRAADGVLRPEHRWPDDRLYAAAAADLDGDGRRELYVGTGPTCEIVELSRDDRGAWTRRVVYDIDESTESSAHSLLAIDLDRDGREELVAALGGWRAYDIRVLRKDPATGRLVAAARDKLGASYGVGGLRGPGGEPRVVAEVFHHVPNPLVFPPEHPYGAPPGTYLLALERGRLVRRAHVPFIQHAAGSSDGVHAQALVGDADGDGRDDFANHYTSGDTHDSIVQLQGTDGGFVPVLLRGVDLLAFAQLDDDPADELLVNDVQAGGAPALWALGVGDERLPVRESPVPEVSSGRDAIEDPLLRRGLAGADDLRGLGLFADAADAYEELAPLAAPGPQRSGVLVDAAALRERLGDDAAARDLYRRAVELAPGTAGLRGVFRGDLRLGHYADALAALAELRARPDLPPAENADLIAGHDRLASAVADDTAIDVTFERPLAPPWTIVDPLALRRRPLARALQVETAAPGVLAELPLEWDGEVLDLTVDLAIDHDEWSSALLVELVPEAAPERPALRLQMTTHGTSRGGQPAAREYSCDLGRGIDYLNKPPQPLSPSTAKRSRARLRAFTLGPLGEMGCGLADLDGGAPRTLRRPMTTRLGAPGRYKLVLRATSDVPAWLSVQIERIALRGARLGEQPPVDPDRAALHAALVEGDALGALAALDRLGAPAPRERVWRALLLVRVGRLAEAEPHWRAILEDPDPAVRGALHTLLRGHHAEIGHVLRAISEPRYFDALAVAWRNTGVNHLDDPRVEPVFLDILQTLAPAALAPDGAGAAALLRAADLLTWRARLHARARRREAARDDFTRAVELCQRAGPAAAQRASLLRLDLASLAADAGDATLAREHIRAARAVSEMPLLVEDIIRAREELAAIDPAP